MTKTTQKVPKGRESPETDSKDERMMVRDVRYPIAASLVAISLLGLTPGCATFGAKKPLVQPSAVLPASTPSVPAQFDDDSEQKLAAVADFLERTVDYQLPAQESEPATTPIEPTYARRPLASRTEPLPNVVSPSGQTSRAVSTNAQMSVSDVMLASNKPALPFVRSLSIRTVPDALLSTPETPQTKTANAPLGTGETQTRRSVDQFFSYLETRAGDDRDFDSEWQLRMAQLALHRENDAVELSPHVTGETRDLFGALIRTAAAVRGVLRNPLLTGKSALAQVGELQTLLAVRADPEIPTVELCRKVVTFGVYDSMSDTDFVAGRTTPAIVYTEIRNFTSEPVEDNRFRTMFATRLEVLTAAGQSVWTHEEPEIEDLCRRRRTDFFVAQRITLPPTLAAGPYVLKVMIEDKLSGKADEALHPFTINAAVTSARTP